MSAETEKLLREGQVVYIEEQIGALCRSCASFIAEIDSSSADVASYLEQRLGPLLRMAYMNGGLDAFRRTMIDARKLSPYVTPSPPERQPK